MHGKATGILYGAYDLTRMLKSISVSAKTDATDATMFQADGKEYVAGLSDSTISASGRYEGEVDATQAVFEDAQGQDAPINLLVVFGGWKIGNRCRIAPELTSKFDVSSPVADLVSTAAAFQTSGPLRGAKVLNVPAVATASQNGATLDGAAGTSADGRVQLHVTANTRSAGATFKVQHSTNGTVWTDLHTLAVVPTDTLVGAVETVPGPINRYTRLVLTLAAGTGQIAFVAALARN